MLGRIRKNIQMFTAATVHKSFVLPILDYFNTVWGCCGSVNADKLPRTTRSSGKLRLPSNKFECKKKAFFIMVV